MIINPFIFGSSEVVPDVLWWKLNDGSGTTITAAVGPNGTTDADWVVGKSGAGFALSFTPANGDDASTNSAVDWGGTTEGTICFWLKPDEIGFADVLSSNGGFSAPGGFGITCLFAFRAAVAGASGGGYTERTANTAPTIGSWTHIIVTFSVADPATDFVKIYYNNVEQATSSGANLTIGGALGNKVVHVGSRGDSTNVQDGAIDDVRLFKRLLSDTERAAVMNDAQ